MTRLGALQPLEGGLGVGEAPQGHLRRAHQVQRLGGGRGGGGGGLGVGQRLVGVAGGAPGQQ